MLRSSATTSSVKHVSGVISEEEQNGDGEQDQRHDDRVRVYIYKTYGVSVYFFYTTLLMIVGMKVLTDLTLFLTRL